MHTLEIPDKNISITFPSEIDEMTSQQFILYIDLVLQYVSGKIDEVTFKARLVQKLLDIRMSFGYVVMNPMEKEQCDTEVQRLAELMECFIEEYQKEGKPVKAFKLKSVRNFVPVLAGYHGPRDCFENVTFCEYRTAKGFFKEFAEDGNEKALNNLCAVLYRPAKRFWFLRKHMPSCDGEIRVPFIAKSNPFILEKRAEKIGKLPFHVRYTVFLYFSGCEDFLKTGKPVVDGIELDFSQLYKSDNDNDDNPAGNVGTIGLLYSLAETGVFGTIEQTDNANIWDIMVRLYQVVMQMKSLEAKTKSHGSGS